MAHESIAAPHFPLRDGVGLALLALFVVPTMYVILHRAGDAVKRFVLGDRVRPVRVGEVAGD